ncbi:CPCC family cysteine-rich protein [Nostoc sp.]
MDTEGLYPCPCCGYKTLNIKPPGTYLICPICFWVRIQV